MLSMQCCCLEIHSGYTEKIGGLCYQGKLQSLQELSKFLARGKYKIHWQHLI